MQVVNTQVSSNTEYGHYNHIYLDAQDILLRHQLDNEGQVLSNDDLYPLLLEKYGEKMPEKVMFEAMMVKFGKGTARY